MKLAHDALSLRFLCFAVHEPWARPIAVRADRLPDYVSLRGDQVSGGKLIFHAFRNLKNHRHLQPDHRYPADRARSLGWFSGHWSSKSTINMAPNKQSRSLRESEAGNSWVGARPTGCSSNGVVPFRFGIAIEKPHRSANAPK
jgi:hypothetical protein